jgi:hypothetical protein
MENNQISLAPNVVSTQESNILQIMVSMIPSGCACAVTPTLGICQKSLKCQLSSKHKAINEFLMSQSGAIMGYSLTFGNDLDRW